MSRQLIIDGNKVFNSRTHVRDAKGTITKVNPYVMICLADGRQFFRDKGTNNYYHPNGDDMSAEEIASLIPPKHQPKKEVVEKASKVMSKNYKEKNPEPLLDEKL